MRAAINNIIDKLRDMEERLGDSEFTSEINEAIDYLSSAHDRLVEIREAEAEAEADDDEDTRPKQTPTDSEIADLAQLSHEKATVTTRRATSL